MMPSDWIAIAALATSVVAAAVAVRALQEAKRTNRIALLSHRVAIHDAFRALAMDALTQGAALETASVEKFAGHASAAEKYLPSALAEEVAAFFDDCERIVWARGLQQPADPEYIRRGNEAWDRVRHSALVTQEKLLALVRAATDANPLFNPDPLRQAL